MANVLTMTPNPNESNEDFAARVSEQATDHFGDAGAAPAPESAPEAEPEPAATDDSAEAEEAVPPA